MDGRNLFVFFVYHTDNKGIIMNSVVLEDFPLDRLVTGPDMDTVKSKLVEVATASEVESATKTPPGQPPEKVNNLVVMDWRWMDRPATTKASGHKRDVRV